MTTSHFKCRHDIAYLWPIVDAISEETPKIQDAKSALSRLAFREKAPLTEIVNYFLQKIPEQTRYCASCEQDVPMYEFATDQCLDCVQADYTARALQ